MLVSYDDKSSKDHPTSAVSTRFEIDFFGWVMNLKMFHRQKLSTREVSKQIERDSRSLSELSRSSLCKNHACQS